MKSVLDHLEKNGMFRIKAAPKVHKDGFYCKERDKNFAVAVPDYAVGLTKADVLQLAYEIINLVKCTEVFGEVAEECNQI